MLSNIRPTADQLTLPLVRHLSRVSPNLLTLIGIVPSLVFFLLIQKNLYLWAIIIYPGNAIDMLDGAVAKRFNKVTPFGGFLDSTLDRVVDFFLITSFGFSRLVSWPTVTILLFISFLVSYTRSRAELASGGKKKFALGLIERPERLVLIYVSFVLFVLIPNFHFLTLNILEVGFCVIILLSFITLLQRIWYSWIQLKID